jgi:hypothetical protein
VLLVDILETNALGLINSRSVSGSGNSDGRYFLRSDTYHGLYKLSLESTGTTIEVKYAAAMCLALGMSGVHASMAVVLCGGEVVSDVIYLNYSTDSTSKHVSHLFLPRFDDKFLYA